MLFWSILFDNLFCGICKKKNKKLKKLMEKGEMLLEEELDIIRIIKSIRMINKEDKSKFVIDLDDKLNESEASHFDKT